MNISNIQFVNPTEMKACKWETDIWESGLVTKISVLFKVSVLFEKDTQCPHRESFQTSTCKFSYIK